MEKNCRMQYLAVKKEVDELIEQGADLLRTYRHFTEKGKISMSYPAWTKIIKNNGQKGYSIPKRKKSIANTVTTPTSTPSRTFVHNKFVDPQQVASQKDPNKNETPKLIITSYKNK